jgi:uncharacterized membrane protein YccF (DUF307 family)
MSNFVRVWLIATGIGAAITLLAPSVVIVAAITIIGLPLALALMLAPLAFILSFGSWLIGRAITPHDMRSAWARCRLPPCRLHHQPIDGRAASVAQDLTR